MNEKSLKYALKYTLCESLDSRRLLELVNGFINKGWTPLGGISITGEYHGIIVYCQALTKEKIETMSESDYCKKMWEDKKMDEEAN